MGLRQLPGFLLFAPQQRFTAGKRAENPPVLAYFLGLALSIRDHAASLPSMVTFRRIWADELVNSSLLTSRGFTSLNLI
jgi:hypothetical protein